MQKMFLYQYTRHVNREKIQKNALVLLLTVMHFTVDGICGAVLADLSAFYADWQLQAEALFGYSLLAFGGQIFLGLLLDLRTTWLRISLACAFVLLFLGTLPGFGIVWQVLCIGLGNGLFHVAGGRYVLLSSNRFSEPGLFVSSGAIGLALGLHELVALWPFLLLLALCTVLFVVFFQPLRAGTTLWTLEKGEKWPLLLCALLLLSCVCLRGFGGRASLPFAVMLMPCVFALGKILGGVVCDVLGCKRTILGLFLVSVFLLQWEGLIPFVLFVLCCNMTMPLTLRLLYLTNPRFPGLMFGLAAACLLPGAFFRDLLSLAPQATAVLQFIGLSLAWMLYTRSKERVVQCTQ